MMKFYEEENEKQISFWKFLEITKLTSGLNPTHSFELLKSHRLKQYEDKLVASTDKRLLNELETTLFDISMLYSEWLNNEMKVVEQWLSDKHPNGDKKKPLSFEEKIEIVKYKTFISNEIDSTISDEPNNKKVDSIISDKPIESNPHPNIFVDKFSFDLFEILFDLYKNNENKNANFSFVYHQMLKDKKIQEYCKAEMFRDWLNKQPYMMNIEELFKSSSKALTEKKIDNYNSLRDVLKNSTL